MRNLIRIASFMLLSALGLRADQVTLKNGDRITGAVVKKDADKLTVKTEAMGDVTIAWSSVAGITSDQPLVVVLPDQRSVTGKVETKGQNLEITTPTTTETAPLGAVSAVRNAAEQSAYERLQHPRLLDLWSGNFALGYALARGNARSDTLATSFNASRVTSKDKITLYFNQLYAKSRVNNVVATSADALRGGWSYNRDVAPRLFLVFLNDYDYDRFQDLDLRFVIGGGLGYSVIKTERTRLDLLGGVDYERENFSTGLTRRSAEVFFGDDFTWKASGVTSITQTFRIFPNLTNTGEYRINFDVGANTVVRKWLSWQITFSDRYLSNPVAGRQRNDLLLTTGLRASFAQ